MAKDENLSYPENLVKEIYQKEPDLVLAYERDNLEQAMRKKLSPRELNAVVGYYRDGLSLTEVGENIGGVTCERARQLIAKAVRKMRHPAFQQLVKLGWNYESENEKVRERWEELDKKKAQLEEMEEQLRAREREIKQKMDETGITLSAIDDYRKAHPPVGQRSPARGLETPLWDMGLSTRSFNALTRNGAEVAGDIVELMKANGLEGIRCLGRKSREEVMERVEAITGVRYVLAGKIK